MMRSTKRKSFIIDAIFIYISVSYLVDVLPTLGYSMPAGINNRLMLLVLFLPCMFSVLYKTRISAHSIAFFFFALNCYEFFVTYFNAGIQQQPLYYYAVSIFFPFLVTFLFKRFTNDQISFHFTLFSLTGFIFIPLIIQYRTDVYHVITGGGESSIYYVLTLLPFCFSLNGKKKAIGMIAIIGMVLIAFKRTALISLIVSILIYYTVLYNKKDTKKLRIAISLVGLFVAAILLYQYIVNTTGNDIIAKLMMSKEDNGSKRLDVYASALTQFDQSGFFQKLFGIGYNGVRYTYGINISGDNVSAHNDFIEVLCDYGIVGFVLYLIIIIRFVRLFFVLKKRDSVYAPAMGAALGIFLTMSMLSHLLIYPTYYINLLIFFTIMEMKTENRAEIAYKEE